LLAVALVANEWVLGSWLAIGGKVTNPATRAVLALVDFAALGIGLTFIIKRERAPWRQMILAVAATLFAFALAEGGLRVFFTASAWISPQSRQVVEKLGWRPAADTEFDREVPGFGRVKYRTVRAGFRLFGNPATTKKKVLVIGDSFTEGETVSAGEAYYERIAHARADLEFFAFGGGGWGTLQEYLLLDEWADEIRPDLVIVQMHPNDLINNSHALESRSTTDNNQMTRPYWEHGRAVSRFPENPSWGPLYNLARNSYVLRLINVNVVFLRAKRVGSIEQNAAPDDPDVIRARDTTAELLKMMQRRARAPVVVFSARPDRAFSFWTVSDVASRAGVAFLPGVGEAIERAQAAGEKPTGLPIDAHWNARGHEIAARVILDWLDRNGWARR
jgi:hypothetical protein